MMSDDESTTSEQDERVSILKSDFERMMANLTAKTKIIEAMMKRNKEKNIVIFGIREMPGESNHYRLACIGPILRRCGLENTYIDDQFRLGRPAEGKTRPILVKFVAMMDKKIVMEGVRHLKGSQIYIRNDLTRTEQEDERKLKGLLREMKADDPNINTKFERGKLVVYYEGGRSTYSCKNGEIFFE